MAEPTLVTAAELARTYDPPSYPDPWELVEDYRRVLEFASHHPTMGSSAIAARVDLPRSRIRPWVDGDDPAKPDCVHAVDLAVDREWLPLTYATSCFQSFNCLVAWIYSGGSIAHDWYRPSFTITPSQGPDQVTTALDDLGVACETIRADDQRRATEVRPTENSSIVGRLLVLLGAPVGQKNDQSALELPAYLSRAPEDVRRQFAQTYIRNRAGERYCPGDTIRFREERSNAYLGTLAKFFEDTLGGPVTVSDRNVQLSPEASQELVKVADI